MNERHATICDADEADDIMVQLLKTKADRRVLTVKHHPERPATKLITCLKWCKSEVSPELGLLVRALSVMPGQRSFPEDSCKNGIYIGNNPWGLGLERRTTYCPNCGYLLTGRTLDHLTIHMSDDLSWNKSMLDQCERGAMWCDGENLGITYELIDPPKKGFLWKFKDFRNSVSKRWRRWTTAESLPR